MVSVTMLSMLPFVVAQVYGALKIVDRMLINELHMMKLLCPCVQYHVNRNVS